MSIKSNILSMIFKIYRMIFVRKIFIKFNRTLYHFSLNGMGILNWENSRISGEDIFLRRYLKDKTINDVWF